MPENKKQHYVPKMYLRNFSWGDRVQINIALVRSGKRILAGNLAGQCYEDYFYGENLVVEKAFGALEGRAQEVLNTMIQTARAPPRWSTNHHAFLVFTLLQRARTVAAAAALNEQLDKVAKAALEASGSMEPEMADTFKIKYKNAVGNSLRAAAECVPLAQDLACKVLVNKTAVNFITSDNPAIFYNQFGERRTIGSNVGIVSKGLEIFLPLSPRHVGVLYDAQVYKVGRRRDLYGEVTDPRDVRKLNDLQWLNAMDAVYFSAVGDCAEIIDGYSRNVGRRNNERAQIELWEPKELPDGRTATDFRTSQTEHRLSLELACIRMLQKITDEERGARARLVRDPLMIKEHALFMKEVEAGKFSVSQWGEFLRERAKLLDVQP